jgi:hypothetical protein
VAQAVFSFSVAGMPPRGGVPDRPRITWFVFTWFDLIYTWFAHGLVNIFAQGYFKFVQSLLVPKLCVNLGALSWHDEPRLSTLDAPESSP